MVWHKRSRLGRTLRDLRSTILLGKELVDGGTPSHTIQRADLADASAFVRKCLPNIASQYALVLEFAKWDPQKIAKAPESYVFAVQQFRNALRDR